MASAHVVEVPKTGSAKGAACLSQALSALPASCPIRSGASASVSLIFESQDKGLVLLACRLPLHPLDYVNPVYLLAKPLEVKSSR